MKERKIFGNVTGPRWWWASFAVATVGLLSARYIYLSSLSFWLKRPDAVATAAAIAIAAVCLGAFIMMSARRATEIGSSPKALLTTLLVLPIPFWILALGSLPEKTEANPFPLGILLRRLKLTVGIALVVGAVTLAAYYHLGNRDIKGYSSSGVKQNAPTTEQQLVPSLSECYDKGIAYFKEIGSYPRLSSTGEFVPDVVEDRCQRSRLAFGN